MTDDSRGGAPRREPSLGSRFALAVYAWPLALGLLGLMAWVNRELAFWVGLAVSGAAWLWAWVVMRRVSRDYGDGLSTARLPARRLLLPTLVMVAGFVAPWLMQGGFDLGTGTWGH
ncbi:hypothetical protein ACQP1U_05645 [Actinomycetota bacterium]